VDSCLFEQTATPIALAYFEALNIKPNAAIKAIIATHWHDDHYKGLSKIMQSAPDARVCISIALTNKEFLQFAARMRKNKTAIAGTKLNEFSAAIHEIMDRKVRGLLNFSLAHVRTRLHSLSAAESGHGFPCELDRPFSIGRRRFRFSRTNRYNHAPTNKDKKSDIFG